MRRWGVSVVLAVALASAAPAAADVRPFGALDCAPHDGYRLCSGDRVPSWDGVSLDVDVALPEQASDALPLVVVLTGYPAAKALPGHDYLLTSPDTWARRGYAALALAPRGMTTSCGPRDPQLAAPGCAGGHTHLADSRYEVRDVQHLIGRLVDEGVVDPARVGVTGESYGGGQALQLAALRNRIRLPDGSFAPWRSPAGLPLEVSAAVPLTTWDDLARSFTPGGSGAVVGVPKLSLLAAFTALGVPDVNNPPAGPGSEVSLAGWLAAMAKGEPYGADTTAFLDEFRRFHSAAGIPFAGRPAPTLLANGFADDVFPVDEAAAFAARAAAVPGAHVAEVHGDFGHPRSTSPATDRERLRSATAAWFDRWLRDGDEPVARVEVWAPSCPAGSGSEGPFRARSWAALTPTTLVRSDPVPRVVTGPGGNPLLAGRLDPAAMPQAGVTRCATVEDRAWPGTAVYRFPAARGAGHVLLGAPRVAATVRIHGADAPNVQLAARLWDVGPAGNQILVSRGFHRPLGDGPTAFALHRAAHRFRAGHVAKLEVLGSDAPYGRAGNLPFTIELSGARVELPVQP